MEKPELHFIDEDQLALRWGCTIRKLQKDRLTGDGLAFHRLGGLIRYKLEDVIAYEAERKFTRTSEYHK